MAHDPRILWAHAFQLCFPNPDGNAHASNAYARAAAELAPSPDQEHALHAALKTINVNDPHAVKRAMRPIFQHVRMGHMGVDRAFYENILSDAPRRSRVLMPALDFVSRDDSYYHNWPSARDGPRRL
jgi:hypothetical protein